MEAELAACMRHAYRRWRRILWILEQRPDLRTAALTLEECQDMTTVPESVFKLTNLTTLQIRSCLFLTAVPEGLGQLEALRVLDFSRCYNLMGLSKSLGQLTQLETLDLSWCCRLQELPPPVGQLHRLTHLNLAHCPRLRRMPTSMVNLSCTLVYLSRPGAGMFFPPAAVAAQGLSAVKRFMFGDQFAPIMLLLILAARRRRMRHPPAELWALVRDEFFLFC
jgi:hypothetical protein